MEPVIITSMFVILMIGTAVALYRAMYGDYRALEERVESLAVSLRSGRGNGGFHFPAGSTDGLVRTIVKLTAQRLTTRAKPDKDSSVAKLLVQAGYRGPTAVASYRAIQVLLLAGLGFVGAMVGMTLGFATSLSLMMMVAGGFLGAILPKFFLLRWARHRRVAISRQLSDVLDLLVVCVEAGLGIHESISMVGRETARHGQEIGTEMVILSHDMSSGVSLGEAMRRFAARTDLDDIKPLAAAIIQSEQLGAQMAPALKANSDALRTKRRLKAEETAQKATIKILFPLVLFVLPAMLLVIVGPSMVHVIKTISG